MSLGCNKRPLFSHATASLNETIHLLYIYFTPIYVYIYGIYYIHTYLFKLSFWKYIYMTLLCIDNRDEYRLKTLLTWLLLATYLPTLSTIYLLTYLSICLLTYLPPCLFNNLPAIDYLPTKRQAD